MLLWVVFFGSALSLLAILIAARTDVELDVRARGEPDGAWFAAFGAAVGPLAVATALSRDTALRYDLFCFGRRLDFLRKRRRPPRPDRPTKPPKKAAEEPGKPLASRIDEATKHARFALGLERHVRVESLALDVVYGFRDVALTGRIAGGLAMLSGLVPRTVAIRQTPLWDGEERWEIRATGRIGLWLGLVLSKVLWYMLRTRLFHGEDQHLRDRGQPAVGRAGHHEE